MMYVCQLLFWDIEMVDAYYFVIKNVSNENWKYHTFNRSTAGNQVQHFDLYN